VTQTSLCSDLPEEFESTGVTAFWLGEKHFLKKFLLKEHSVHDILFRIKKTSRKKRKPTIFLSPTFQK
jgi:hypothetical protein